MQLVLPPDLIAAGSRRDSVPERRIWSALSISVVLHAAFAVFLLFGTANLNFDNPRPPDYKVVVIPIQPKKIVFRSLKSIVPEVAPQERFGPEPTPHGQKDNSGQVLIANAPKPDSTKQFIRQPDHPEPIPVDVPTPNLIAMQPDAPQPVPKPAPKVFVPPPPPPVTVKTPQPVAAVLEPPPNFKPTKIPVRTDLGQFLTQTPKAPARVFKPTAASPTTAMTDPAAVKEMSAPPSNGAPALAIPGPSAVIVSLNPGVGPPPQGSRTAQFARAPEAGTPSSGAGPTGAVTVPGLIAHGRPGEVPKPPVIPTPGPDTPRRIVKEIVLPGFNRTMSAPLRPSSRIIPRSVEALFANRNVYTLVIPGPELPGYTGDWVVWFAERQVEEDLRVRISAPVPVRKYAATVPNSPGGSPVNANVQFSVILDKTGRIANAKVIRGATDPALRLKAMEELETWDFKPALRNGEPIEVDLVIEIPVELRLSPAPPR